MNQTCQRKFQFCKKRIICEQKRARKALEQMNSLVCRPKNEAEIKVKEAQKRLFEQQKLDGKKQNHNERRFDYLPPNTCGHPNDTRHLLRVAVVLRSRSSLAQNDHTTLLFLKGSLSQQNSEKKASGLDVEITT